ncbi:MAG: hypothetical protein ABEI52_07145 [Halobacteriaceae archaeon]
MAGELSRVRQNAVPLRDDSIGVATENNPRKLQSNGNAGSYYCTLNPDWLEQLQLAEQGEATLHSVSMGTYPVLVQNPAIIIQPASVIEGE